MAWVVAQPALTEQITTALTQLRKARDTQDHSAELTWTYMLDRLLDRYCAGQR